MRLKAKQLKNWQIFPLPLNNISRLKFSSALQQEPACYRGTFELQELGDTSLDMRGWGQGILWANGHNLGRYCHIGPQQSLFVPSGWMHESTNSVIVLDLGPAATIVGIEQLLLETPHLRH